MAKTNEEILAQAPRPASGQAWERARLTRASDEIVRQIRNNLLEGRLSAGDHLGSENQLAAQFGVSRTTMRDALRTLEAGGIVEIRTGVKGGVRVAYGDPLRFADSLAVQLHLVGIAPADAVAAQVGLECVAAELAAANANDDDDAEFRRVLHEAKDFDNVANYRATSYSFHDAIARASHNWPIIATLRAVHDIVREPPSRIWNGSLDEAKALLEQHGAIYEAIRQGDGQLAARLMREHVDHTALVASSRAVP